MSNLSIENLGQSMKMTDLPGLDTGSGVASQSRVEREMRNQGLGVPSETPGEAGTTFSDLLRKSVDQVNQEQVQANDAIKELVAGRTKNIHETMLTIEKADTSLKLMMQVRNKVLDAYREIMRMQV